METEQRLSLFWIFLTVNYIYCDVFSLHDAATLKQLMTGVVGGMEINQGFLAAFSVVMELPMIMIVLSRLLPYTVNRWANVVIGVVLAAIQLWSLTVGSVMLHYAFFSVVEIATLAIIVWTAFVWREPATATA